ncbi:MAG: hypothetical protein IJ285_03480 [Clostridia bacterium]|nr:hypothetical protein [Clostridia bacterium]
MEEVLKYFNGIGVDTLIGFSDCFGDCEKSENPNWVNCAWSPEYLDILYW